MTVGGPIFHQNSIDTDPDNRNMHS